MFALSIRFPAGRYHATPWGKHVNEGEIAWPPEPYRILRALIATWHRKADHARFPKAELDALIHELAKEKPHFYLPNAVHAHTRHYMPGKSKPVLVLDAFLRLRPEDRLIAAWRDTSLEAKMFALAEHLAERISYFGRAESIAAVTALHEYHGLLNCFPSNAMEQAEGIMLDVLTPLSPETYASTRERLLRLNTDKLSSKKRPRFEASLPQTLRLALEVETSHLQEAGWSRPPAGCSTLYQRPQIGPQPPMQLRQNPRPKKLEQKLFTAARLVVAGKPKPSIEEAIKIGELFRRALLYKTGHPCQTTTPLIPEELKGRDAATGAPATSNHDHAFFLPEDADQDGFIDHLVLYARSGLSEPTQRALGSLHRLWIDDKNKRKCATNDDDEDPDEGRREWRLALEGFGTISDFADDCALLHRSQSWVSATPYLRPWHLKARCIQTETIEMVEKECRLRNLPLERAEFQEDGTSITFDKGKRNVLAFHRFRDKQGLVQPDRSGTALRLTFSEPVEGPIALGFGCHYGLGLFRAEK